MTRRLQSIFFVLSIAVVGPLAGCDEDEGDGGGGGSGEAKVGGSCDKDKAGTSGLNACDGKDILACSALSDYKWSKTLTCGENETCKVAADMMSAQCAMASASEDTDGWAEEFDEDMDDDTEWEE